MARDHHQKRDPDGNASRIKAESGEDTGRKSAEAEAAWVAWSAHIQRVDERAAELLKEAFEAGYKAGSRNRQT